jgi:transcriptional regulator with XRE-family HTH domain
MADMSLVEKVGHRIRQIRIARGLTQEELAFRSGLHQSQIYRLENGKRRFNSMHLENISQALKVPVLKLFQAEFRISDEIEDDELLKMLSQLTRKTKTELVNFIQYLCNSEIDIQFIHLKSSLEFIESIKHTQTSI